MKMIMIMMITTMIVWMLLLMMMDDNDEKEKSMLVMIMSICLQDIGGDVRRPCGVGDGLRLQKADIMR